MKMFLYLMVPANTVLQDDCYGASKSHGKNHLKGREERLARQGICHVRMPAKAVSLRLPSLS
jgi:hypothetical protein